jgi:hypothetical protein
MMDFVSQKPPNISHRDIPDDEFMSAFEHLTLVPGLFNHEAHIRLAWLYFRIMDNFRIGIAKLSNGIKAYDQKFSSAAKYHHTITVAFACIIYAKMFNQTHDSWRTFIELCPELMHSKTILSQFYTLERLNSEEGRIKFLMPDKLPKDSKDWSIFLCYNE